MRIRVMLAGVATAILASCGSDPGVPRNDCGGEMVDLQTDLDHCGDCETVCPTQEHAARTCAKGQCGRAPCESGWVDLDPLVAGCETEAGFSALPEAGVVFWAFPAAGAYGDTALTSTSYRMEGSLGESTPTTATGNFEAVELKSTHYSNVTGFNAILH